MSQMVAIELARMLEQGVPHVKARAVGLGGGFVVLASFLRSGKAHPIAIKDTTEFSLLMYFLEQQAEQAGKPFITGKVMEDDRAKEPVYQY
jgi:hypothetical protein